MLLDLRSGGELLIGRMPDDVPGAAALAAGARVVGSVVYRDQSRTALAVPEHVAAAREEFDARLRTAGWTEREGAGRQERGFLPAYAEDRFRLFCWPATEAQLSMTVQRAPAGGSYVVFHYNAPRRNGFCSTSTPPREMAMRGGIHELMPTLRLPDGASLVQSRGSSSSGGGGEVETRMGVTTQLSPAQLIAHFEPQLREHGWSPVEQLRGDRLAVQYAQKERDAGTVLLLWVSAYRMQGDETGLSMRLVAADKGG
ncbi:MAG: hypothetical protein ACRELT_14605 [Longimicrobiales bacterium]